MQPGEAVGAGEPHVWAVEAPHMVGAAWGRVGTPQHCQRVAMRQHSTQC